MYQFKNIVRGAFGKYVVLSFFSVTDKQTHSCLVSFKTHICPLCYDTIFMRILWCRQEIYHYEYMYFLFIYLYNILRG